MKEKSHKTSIVLLLLCTILFTLFEPFGMTNIYASVNRSISSDSDKTAKIDSDGNLRFSLQAKSINWNPVADSGIVCHQ